MFGSPRLRFIQARSRRFITSSPMIRWSPAPLASAAAAISRASRRAWSRSFIRENTGVLFPKDADFVFQMHYTPNGQGRRRITARSASIFREATNPPDVSVASHGGSTDLRSRFRRARKNTTAARRLFQREHADLQHHAALPFARARRHDDARCIRTVAKRFCSTCRSTTSTGRRCTSNSSRKTIPAGSKLVWRFSWDNSA